MQGGRRVVFAVDGCSLSAAIFNNELSTINFDLPPKTLPKPILASTLVTPGNENQQTREGER